MSDERAWPRPVRKWETAGTGEKVSWRGREFVLYDESTDGEGSIQLTLLTSDAWKEQDQNRGMNA